MDLLRAGDCALALDPPRIRAVGPDGGPLAAGDGLASLLAHAATTGELGDLTVSAGSLHAVPVRVAGGPCAPGDPPRAATETAIAVDQTNRSLVVSAPGRVPVVVKLVAEWGAADRAARLLTRLTAAGSRDIPRYRGRVDWVHPSLGRGTVALVSDLVEGAEDGWTWAVADLVAHLRDSGPAPSWPARLGELTARLHLALATDSVPAPAGARVGWRRQAEAALEEALALTTGPAGARLANRAAAMRAVIATLPDDTTGPLFATHGDLHVGQLVRAGERYQVLDLDGDPQLPLGERDLPQPAARDLAHLLVSVDQVACVAQRRVGRADPAYPAWARDARATLQASYADALAVAGRADLLDARLLPGLEAEAIARELVYAARFLPRWTYAGDGTVVARFPAAPDTEEAPWTPPASEPT